MGAEAARRQPRVRMPPIVARPRSPRHGVDDSESRRELDLIIAEFTSLRNEIDRRISTQTQILNFTALLVAGTTAAVFAAFNSGSFEKARPFIVFGLLVSSALFAALLYTFTEQEYEEMFVASYIERRLRVRASQLLRRKLDEANEVFRILDWEVFRRRAFRRPPRIGGSAWPGPQGDRREEPWRRRVVRKVGRALRFWIFVPSYYGRSMLMLIPSVLCLVFALVIFLVGPPPGWMYTVWFVLFFVLDLIYAAFAYCFAHAIRHAHRHRIQPM